MFVSKKTIKRENTGLRADLEKERAARREVVDLLEKEQERVKTLESLLISHAIQSIGVIDEKMEINHTEHLQGDYLHVQDHIKPKGHIGFQHRWVDLEPGPNQEVKIDLSSVE